MLKLYVDSAVRHDVEPLLQTGLFHGVTTNPTLLRNAGLSMAELPDVYAWATGSGAREVFFQAWGDRAARIVDRGRELRDLGPRAVVKVPAHREGVVAAAQLAAEGCPVLLTAVYNASQSLLAAAAGATYVAPYLGRMDDAGRAGHDEVRAMQAALAAVGSSTEILVASVRTPGEVVQLARHGISAYALSPAVIAQLFEEELTTAAVRVFEDAAQAISGV